MLIEMRKRHPALRRRTFFRGAGPTGELEPDIIWHGVEPGEPDFSDTSRTLAFVLDGDLTGREPDRDFYVACNAWREVVKFRIPPSPSGRRWRRALDTALMAPLDIMGSDEGPMVPAGSRYLVQAHSLLVLIAEGE
jgi:isoamylase